MADSVRIALTISSRSNGTAPTLPTYRGFLLAMEDAAKRTDLPAPVEWVLFDDHGDTTQTARQAETIVADDRFIGVVGPMGSTEAFVNAPIFDAAGLLQVSPCGSHPDLCEQGYSTFHRLVANESVQGGALARLARNQLAASEVAVVHDRDAFGTAVADNFSSALEATGGTVVARVSLEQGDTDFSAQVADVVAAGPELVFFGVHATEGLGISSALREAGLEAPFLGTDGLKTSFFLGGGDPGSEAYHTHSGADFRRLAAASDFRARYAARWPEDSTYSPEAYDSGMLIVEALAAAKEPTRGAVLAAFEALGTHEGVSGSVAFDDKGERVGAPVSWYRVERRDGERYMAYQGIVT